MNKKVLVKINYPRANVLRDHHTIHAADSYQEINVKFLCSDDLELMSNDKTLKNKIKTI